MPVPRHAGDSTIAQRTKLVIAYRRMRPIEEAGAWMVRVARNRIIDLVRKKKAVSLNQTVGAGDDDSSLRLESPFPAVDVGPDADYARRLLITELEDALAELTPNLYHGREIWPRRVVGRDVGHNALTTGSRIGP